MAKNRYMEISIRKQRHPYLRSIRSTSYTLILALLFVLISSFAYSQQAASTDNTNTETPSSLTNTSTHQQESEETGNDWLTLTEDPFILKNKMRRYKIWGTVFLAFGGTCLGGGIFSTIEYKKFNSEAIALQDTYDLMPGGLELIEYENAFQKVVEKASQAHFFVYLGTGLYSLAGISALVGGISLINAKLLSENKHISIAIHATNHFAQLSITTRF